MTAEELIAELADYIDGAMKDLRGLDGKTPADDEQMNSSYATLEQAEAMIDRWRLLHRKAS